MATRFVAPDLAPLRQRLAEAEQLFGSPLPILKAFGVQTLAFVDKSFREGGQPAWVPLRPGTLASRREGKGIGSAQPLQNTGKLRRSFDVRVEERRAVVFSDNPVAVFHEFGTRGPYEIRPRFAKALAFASVQPNASGGVKGQFSFSGLGRARRSSSGGLVTAGGKRVAPLKNITFAMKVTHPGLPARPMLPTNDQIVPQLIAGAEAIILRKLLKGAARG